MINDPRSLRNKSTFSCKSSMHPCPGSWVAIGSTVDHARASHAFCVEIKCRYCMYVMCVYTARRHGLLLMGAYKNIIQTPYTVPTSNSCTKYAGSPGMTMSFLRMDAWITPQLNVALICKLQVVSVLICSLA